MSDAAISHDEYMFTQRLFFEPHVVAHADSAVNRARGAVNDVINIMTRIEHETQWSSRGLRALQQELHGHVNATRSVLGVFDERPWRHG